MSKRNLKRQPLKLSDQDAAFLDGYLEAYANFSDGAWQAACESAISECKRFDGKDAYDVWLAWCLRNER